MSSINRIYVVTGGDALPKNYDSKHQPCTMDQAVKITQQESNSRKILQYDSGRFEWNFDRHVTGTCPIQDVFDVFPMYMELITVAHSRFQQNTNRVRKFVYIVNKTTLYVDNYTACLYLTSWKHLLKP